MRVTGGAHNERDRVESHASQDQFVTTVSDYFRDYAPQYDSFTLRAMPRYQEMLEEIVRCLPDRASDILELGCGTGSLTALLARHYPSSAITAIDASAEMIELARDRLGSLAVPDKQVTFVESFFEELDLPEGAYDLIASNMSLHHIVDKGSFYRRLHASLRPGGTLVLGDELTGALPHVQQLNWDGWLRFARDSGGLSDSEIEDIERHEREFDHYETLPRQLELLRDGGVWFGRLRVALFELRGLRSGGLGEHRQMRCGGGGGIRTHEGREPLTVFKTVAFNHSATPPVTILVPFASE